jgi:hypothetical protein
MQFRRVNTACRWDSTSFFDFAAGSATYNTSSSLPVTGSCWHFVAVTKHAAEVNYYWNGQLARSFNNTAPSNTWGEAGAASAQRQTSACATLPLVLSGASHARTCNNRTASLVFCRQKRPCAGL